MVDLDRRPTAQQIEELIDAVRRDPASSFVQLAEAYLALGRPKDVVEVCNVGLSRAGEHIEGRVLLARAHCMLHQWKEAQGELLAVVKADRANRAGFALLGEVLLRRGDVERAVPVLQHAQTLDPSSSHVLGLLRRARTGEPLDPPPPVPAPMLPRDVAVAQANAPTRMHMVAPTPEPAARPQVAKPRPAAPAPVPSIEGVRPRLVSANKPQNAAAAALRQSAAVGENYLNELLTGGLLDVAGVRLPDVQFDLRPDRRMGRSARRAFVVLFLLLFMGLGGGGAWFYWTEKQKTAAVARLQREAKEQVADGSFRGLEGALKSLATALGKDNENALTMAYAAEAAGLQALLYGTDVLPAERAIKGAATEIVQPGQLGYRELVIGRAATKLAQVADAAAKTNTLYDALDALNAYLGGHPDDRWATWLKGRAQWIAGERKAAIATIKAAADGDGGLVVAKIDLADLTADDGKLDAALALYEEAEQASKDHPLAVLGLALTRAENDVDSALVFDDLNVKLDQSLGPRIAAYRELALAFAYISVEDYPRALESAGKATGVSEARFQARRAWLELQLGKITDAASARKKVLWYGKGKAEPDPSAILVDVGLEVAASLAAQALDHAAVLEDLRARRLAAWALIDLDRPKEALAEIEKVLAKAPENLEAKALREYCKIVAGSSKEREAALISLEKLTRGAKSKIVQHLLGLALLRADKAQEGFDELTQAITDLGDEHPNPVAYRTHTRLAEILISQGKLTEAAKALEAALASNPGFLPARGAQGILLLKGGKPGEAYDLLRPLVEESRALSAPLSLAWAEALATRKDATRADKTKAAELLTKLGSDPAVSRDELIRVATLVDPELAASLGGPVEKKPKGRPRRRRGR
ncbi:MAG: hypothetical protein R3B48_06855 [Kofleriaceae bacterium]